MISSISIWSELRIHIFRGLANNIRSNNVNFKCFIWLYRHYRFGGYNNDCIFKKSVIILQGVLVLFTLITNHVHENRVNVMLRLFKSLPRFNCDSCT